MYSLLDERILMDLPASCITYFDINRVLNDSNYAFLIQGNNNTYININWRQQ